MNRILPHYYPFSRQCVYVCVWERKDQNNKIHIVRHLCRLIKIKYNIICLNCRYQQFSENKTRVRARRRRRWRWYIALWCVHHTILFKSFSFIFPFSFLRFPLDFFSSSSSSFPIMWYSIIYSDSHLRHIISLTVSRSVLFMCVCVCVCARPVSYLFSTSSQLRNNADNCTCNRHWSKTHLIDSTYKIYIY